MRVPGRSRAIIVFDVSAAAMMCRAMPAMAVTEEMKCKKTHDQDDPNPVSIKPIHCLAPKPNCPLDNLGYAWLPTLISLNEDCSGCQSFRMLRRFNL